MYLEPGMQLGPDMYMAAGDQYGRGKWDKLFKMAQKSDFVRGKEKELIATAREKAQPMIKQAIKEAVRNVPGPFKATAREVATEQAKKLEDQAVSQLYNKIDQSANGVRYMGAGAGMRVAGAGTRVGRGLRVAEAGHYGHGMRLAGDGLLDDVGDMAVDVAKSQAKKHAPEIVDRAVSYIPGVGPVAAPMAGAATRLLLGSGHCGHGMQPVAGAGHYHYGHGLRTAGGAMRLAGDGPRTDALAKGFLEVAPAAAGAIMAAMPIPGARIAAPAVAGAMRHFRDSRGKGLEGGHYLNKKGVFKGSDKHHHTVGKNKHHYYKKGPAGNGMRTSGAGRYIPSLVEGSGCACH